MPVEALSRRQADRYVGLVVNGRDVANAVRTDLRLQRLSGADGWRRCLRPGSAAISTSGPAHRKPRRPRRACAQRCGGTQRPLFHVAKHRPASPTCRRAGKAHANRRLACASSRCCDEVALSIHTCTTACSSEGHLSRTARASRQLCGRLAFAKRVEDGGARSATAGGELFAAVVNTRAVGVEGMQPR